MASEIRTGVHGPNALLDWTWNFVSALRARCIALQYSGLRFRSRTACSVMIFMLPDLHCKYGTLYRPSRSVLVRRFGPFREIVSYSQWLAPA